MPSTAARLKAYGDWLTLNKDKQGTADFQKVAAEYRALREQQLRGVEEVPAETTAPTPKERAGFINSFMEAARSLEIADEAAEFAANPTEENRRKLIAAGESKFQSVGGFGKGENWEAFKELLGGSLGQLVAPTAAAVGTSFLTTPIGGVAAGAATSTAQYTAQNLLRQAQEQERALAEKRTPEETSALKAAAAGAVSAGLDYVQFKYFKKALELFPFAKNLVTPDSKLREEATKALITAAREGTLKSTGRGTVEGVVKGVLFEIPQEMAQTALERAQAGLSLTDEEAKEELLQAAIGAAVLGPLMGGAAGFRGARAERQQGEELVKAEDKAAADLAEAAKPKPLDKQPPKVPAEAAPLQARQEPANLAPREIQDEILKMEELQAKRAEMLSDLDALRERAENSGQDFDTILGKLTQNFDNTATRIDIFSKRLEELSRPPEETPVTPMAPIPQTGAAQQTIQIDQAVAQGLGLPGAETAPKNQPFTVTTETAAPIAPIPQIAGAQQALGLPSTEPASAAPAETPATPVAPIPQVAAAQQSLSVESPTVVDPLYEQAVNAVIRTGTPTIPMLQKELQVGFNRAARLLEQMQVEGVITPKDKETGQRQITMGQRQEVPSATAETPQRVAEQAQLEPVGGGVTVPPSGAEPAGRVSPVTPVEGVEPAVSTAADVAPREGGVEPALGDLSVVGEARAAPALTEKTSDELFYEIEKLKNQALSLLVGKYGKRPIEGSEKRKQYDAIQERIAELTGQWGRQVSKEKAGVKTAGKSDETPPGLKPFSELEGVELNDLGNAVGRAIKGLPPLATNVKDAIKRILRLKTITDDVRRGVYAFISLHQQAQLFVNELPGLKPLLNIIKARAGALKARREVLDRNVRRWSRIIRENKAQMEEFFEVANESSRLQIEFNSAAYSNHSLTKRFRALNPDLQKIYWEMLESYKSMADEYINLVTKNVSPSAAKEFRAKMTENRLRVYLPLYREGDYWLRYQSAKNETVVRAFETAEERDAAQAEARRQGAKGFQSFGRIENVYEPGAVGPFFDKVVEELRGKGISKEVSDALYNLYLDQIPATSVRQQFRKREGLPGYENNLIKVYSTIASRMANQLTNLEYVPDIDKAYAKVQEEAAVETAQADDLAVKSLMGNLKEQMDYIRNPVNSSLVNGLASFSYYWYIIGNVSTAFINLSQVPMVVYPYLAGRFPGKAGDALTKAKDIYLAGGWDNDVSGEKRKIADWTFAAKLPKDSPLARLYEIAIQQSAIRRSTGYDVVQGQKEEYSESDYVGKKVFIEQALGWTFQNSERFNREVTLIAAFNLELEKNGGDVNAAAQYAIDVVEDTHGSVLNETAPRAFQTGIGKVFFVFKSFAQTQIFLQYRLLREVLKGKDRETQKVAAKQFAGIMGMSFLFAGVQGMPLYGAFSVIAGLLEEAFGDEDDPIDPDEYLRQAISSLAYKGPVSQALQVDIASRTGFNNMLWREDDKRVEEIGPFLFAAEQIFGASYAAGMGFYRAWNDFWDGHTDRAIEAATPAMIRNGLKAWRFASEGAKTRDGQEIVKDFSPYNIAMQVLGFSPLEFAEKTTAAGKIAAQESALDKRKKSIYDKIYLAYKEGNKEDLAEALAARDKFNKSPAVEARSMFIKDEDIRRSIRDRERRAAQSIYGIYVKPKSAAAYDKYKPEGYDEGT